MECLLRGHSSQKVCLLVVSLDSGREKQTASGLFQGAVVLRAALWGLVSPRKLGSRTGTHVSSQQGGNQVCLDRLNLFPEQTLLTELLAFHLEVGKE